MNHRSDLYKHHILDLAKNPSNFGLVANADFFSKKLNPSCGDVVSMCGFISDGKIKNVRFEGTGCVISLAMASLLTDFAKGKTTQEILNFNEELVEQLLDMQLGINRLQCGMLSIVALQDGIRAFLEKNKDL